MLTAEARHFWRFPTAADFNGASYVRVTLTMAMRSEHLPAEPTVVIDQCRQDPGTPSQISNISIGDLNWGELIRIVLAST